MYTLPLFLVIATALAVALSRYGIGSFVTLGTIGAAIYSIPALIDTQIALGARATGSRVDYVSVPPDVHVVVLIAWFALLVGLIVSIMAFPRAETSLHPVITEDSMQSIALACAIVGPLGLFYFAYSQESFLFFLQVRTNQDSGAFSTLWKWVPLIGLVSASLARDRRSLIISVVMLLIIFLRGDRTLVAIATASLVVVASYKDPTWWRRLRPLQVAGFIFAAGVVFVGKSIYIIIKASLVGGSTDRLTVPLTDQLRSQFEPIGTFAHLEFVMRTGVGIPIGQFLESVFGNLLIVPSAFGISTNLYNTVVTSHLSARLSSGVAGNYMAHGYAVGGTAMAAFFYFLMPLMLRLCDSQFRQRAGSIKVFWCCVGAVIAFYIHRNGLDNLFSFVRQIFVVSVIIAALAAALRHLGIRRTLFRSSVPTSSVGGRLREDEFRLAPPPTVK
jgi:hypothetical protein